MVEEGELIALPRVVRWLYPLRVPTKHRWKRGDSIFEIAKQFGFRSPLTIWNSAENDELRRIRSSPYALQQGDQLVVPDKQQRLEDATTAARHTFVVVEPPLPALFARNDGLGEAPVMVMPVFAAPGKTATDPSFVLQLGAALRHAATTTADYRVAMAGRGAGADPALLQSAMHLLRGERQAWLADAGARSEPPDHQAMLTWAANVLGYPTDPEAIDGDFGPASRIALRRFRFAVWKALRGAPPAQGDFGVADLEAFYALFQRQLARISGVAPSDLPEVRARITPADQSIGSFDDRDPIAWDAKTPGLDVLLIDHQAAKAVSGPLFADLKRPARFAFAPMLAEPALEEYVAYILEFVDFEDIHFESDQFLLLPATVEPTPRKPENRDPGGLDAIAAALDHARKHPKRRALVAGHTDPPGDRRENLKLSEKRANSVYYVFQGYGWLEQWIDLAQEQIHFSTVRLILQWVHDRFGYQCAPNSESPATADPLALKAFRQAYNLEVQIRVTTQVNPFKPGFVKPIPEGASEPVGYPGRNTWRAFFEFYQRYLVHALDPVDQELDQAGLTEIQEAVKFVDPFPTVGCGEFHSADLGVRAKRRLALFPEEAGPLRPADRRVEIIFFDPDEVPNFDCHGSAADHPCFPERCNLHDERLYRLRRIPPAGPEPRAEIWFDRAEVEHLKGFEDIGERMLLPRLGETAVFFVRVRKLRTPFSGKLQLSIARGAKDGFVRVALLEKELRVEEPPAGDIWVEFEWNGKATRDVERHLSERTVFDSSDEELVHIPLREIAVNDDVWHGVYEVDQVVLLEKDDSVAGRDFPASGHRRDQAVIVPILVGLHMGGDFPRSLNLLGLGDRATAVPYYKLIRQGIARQCRSKYPDIGIRFVLVSDHDPKQAAAMVIHFVDEVQTFGTFVMGLTDDEVVSSPKEAAVHGAAELRQNLFAWKDTEQGALKCRVGIGAGIYVRNQTTSAPLDRGAFRAVFVPLGVSPNNRIQPDDSRTTTNSDGLGGGDVPSPYVVEEFQLRSTDRSGRVSGIVTEVDEANTSASPDDEGLPTVVTKNVAIVPLERARDIERGLRAIIGLAGTVAAHELGHWLGASTSRASRSFIEVRNPTVTVLAPHDQDDSSHNRVPSHTGLMDDGATKSMRTMLGLDNHSLVFNAEQLSYLSEILPDE